MSGSIISLRGIGKKYRIDQRRFLTKDLVRHLLRRRPPQVDFWALKEIDLDILRGESVGVIGENGSGKSTLLKILSNVTQPTTGVMTVNGVISSLLELGAGFHPYLTGRENVYLNGAILGMRKRVIDRIFDDIVDFSGIGRFIDTPVQNYSSGMYVRLGFSIAVHIDPDILIIDEVLAVGDEEFQRKSKAKIQEFREQGRTILIVSHDLSAIRDICSRVYWLREGRIVEEGDRETITSRYLSFVGARMGLTTISLDRLSVIFEKGKLILFWRGVELTKNFCGHSYLVSATTWQPSMLAAWEVLAHDDRGFTALGRWKAMPIEQTWRVRIESEKEIRWEVEMDVRADCRIKNDTYNLMLTDRYDRWVTPSGGGEFPPEFHESFTQRLIGIGQGEGRIGAQGFSLGGLAIPSVHLAVNKDRDGFLS
ncbi:ABC transporter ATP-binding protein, partial [bacterium]|nr:ABC transporter ATP-binding protein [candidate division CSSED10-310 bacterium]